MLYTIPNFKSSKKNLAVDSRALPACQEHLLFAFIVSLSRTFCYAALVERLSVVRKSTAVKLFLSGVASFADGESSKAILQA